MACHSKIKDNKSYVTLPGTMLSGECTNRE
jgi:hypothetical protein